MQKITLKIGGMACGMCEAHINDAVREKFKVKKVTSSHGKGLTEIICENDIDEESLKSVIQKTGYRLIEITKEPYEKKGFSLFHKK